MPSACDCIAPQLAAAVSPCLLASDGDGNISRQILTVPHLAGGRDHAHTGTVSLHSLGVLKLLSWWLQLFNLKRSMISDVWKAGSFKTKIPSARPVPIMWCRRLAAGARLGPATPRPRPSKQGNLCPLSPTGRGEGGCGQRRQGCSAHLSGGCWTVCVLELSTNLCEISQILIATCDSLKTSVPIPFLLLGATQKCYGRGTLFC